MSEYTDLERWFTSDTGDPTNWEPPGAGKRYSPEQRMLLRLLSEAIRCALCGDADERAWILSEADEVPDGFAFEEVCGHLGVRAGVVRAAFQRREVHLAALDGYHGPGVVPEDASRNRGRRTRSRG